MINKSKTAVGIATYAHWIVNLTRIPNILVNLAKFNVNIENRSIKHLGSNFPTFTVKFENLEISTTQFKLYRLVLWSLLYYFLHSDFELVGWFELRVKKSILRQVLVGISKKDYLSSNRRIQCQKTETNLLSPEQ